MPLLPLCSVPTLLSFMTPLLPRSRLRFRLPRTRLPPSYAIKLPIINYVVDSPQSLERQPAASPAVTLLNRDPHSSVSSPSATIPQTVDLLALVIQRRQKSTVCSNPTASLDAGDCRTVRSTLSFFVRSRRRFRVAQVPSCDNLATVSVPLTCESLDARGPHRGIGHYPAFDQQLTRATASGLQPLLIETQLIAIR